MVSQLACKQHLLLREKRKKKKKSTYLDLVDVRWPHSGIFLHDLNVLLVEIAHPNTLRLALLEQLLQRQPHILDPRRAHPRRVNQEQIHIRTLTTAPIDLVDALDQAGIVGLDAAQVPRDLGREEDVLAGHRRRPQRRARLGLVAVRLRRVNVPVARRQRHLAHRRAHCGVDLPHAKTEQRHRNAVGELDDAVQAEFAAAAAGAPDFGCDVAHCFFGSFLNFVDDEKKRRGVVKEEKVVIET